MSSENVFDETVQKANLLLKAIEEELDWVDSKSKAYSLLRVVIQTLRDRLPVDEAADFGAQLPMLVRGMYYEGWKPAKTPLKFNRAEFIGEVERLFPSDPQISTEKLIQAVLKVLERHISRGEMEHIRSILPGEFSVLFPKEGGGEK